MLYLICAKKVQVLQILLKCMYCSTGGHHGSGNMMTPGYPQLDNIRNYYSDNRSSLQFVYMVCQIGIM